MRCGSRWWSGRWLAWMVAALVMGSGLAGARGQPGGLEPVTPETAGDAGTVGYPTSLAERPLILPAGQYELAAQLRTIDYPPDFGVDWGDWVYSDLRLRAGLGALELRGEADFLLRSSSDYYEPDTFARLGAGAQLPLGGGAAYLDGELFGPFGEYPQLGLHGGYAARRRTAPDVAIEGRAGLGFTQDLPDEGDGFTTLSAEARLAGQIQLHPTWGADFQAGLRVPLADNYEGGFDPRTMLEFGARLIYTTGRLDAFAGVKLLTAYYSERSAVVGVAGRLP